MGRYKVLQGKTTVAYVIKSQSGNLFTPVGLKGEPLAELMSDLEDDRVPVGLRLVPQFTSGDETYAAGRVEVME